jgi:hypothetical protein
MLLGAPVTLSLSGSIKVHPDPDINPLRWGRLRAKGPVLSVFAAMHYAS